MTENELAEMETTCDAEIADDEVSRECRQWARNAKALVAEVRRLRGLIKHAEWFNGIGGYESETGCPWCESDGFYKSSKLGYGKHEANCPAFTPDGNVK